MKNITKIILLIGCTVGMYMIVKNNDVVGWIIAFGYMILYKLEDIK